MNKQRILPALFLAAALLGAQPIWAVQDQHGHDHAEESEQKKEEFKGDPYILDIDPVSGKKLGALDSQVTEQYEGREFRFSNEKSARTFRSSPLMYLSTVDKKLIALQLPFYPLEMCMVSGEKLGGEMGAPIDFIYKNRLIRFCCKGCKSDFLKDPAKYVAKLDKVVVAAQQGKYPLTTCPVSGDALGGAMGPPLDYVVGNRLIRLCCKGCKKDVAKNPLKYLSMLDAAAKSEPDAHGDHEHSDNGEHGHGDFR